MEDEQPNDLPGTSNETTERQSPEKSSKKRKSKKRLVKRSSRKINHRAMVRCFVKYLIRVLNACKKKEIRHAEVASSVIPSLLDVVLHYQWSKIPQKYVDRIVMLLGALSSVSLNETEWVVRDLIEVVKEPWRRHLITSMLHGADDLKVEEVFDLLAKEGLLVVNRVRSLMENKLSKLCLNFLTWVYKCFTWEQRPVPDTLSIPNKQFIYDIYIILLNDLKSNRDVFKVLKSFDSYELLLMVQRLRSEHKRVDIAFQVTNMLLLKMSIHVLDANELNVYSGVLKLFCEMFTRKHKNSSEFKKQINSICKLTSTSDHIYAIAREIFQQFPKNQEMVTLVVELYIRGLTTDANALDKAKCVQKEPNTVRELGLKLSRIFQDVSNMFPEYELRREFILNAFCVNPCAETFSVLEAVANEQITAKSSLPDNCSWHALGLFGVQLCVTCGGLFHPDDANWAEPPVESDEPDPTRLLDPRKTSLAPHLCDDLNVVLASTRIQQLHWHLERSEMFKRCRSYIEQYKDLQLMLSKELEYLNIDYNRFKDMPGINYADDPYYGVEKGYEHFIEEEDDDDEGDVEETPQTSRNKGKRRRNSDDSDDYLPPSTVRSKKSDSVPNKVGRPRKVVDETAPRKSRKDSVETKKKRPANPLKAVKAFDLVDLTKSDSSSSDDRSRLASPILPKPSDLPLPVHKAPVASTSTNTVKSLRAFRPTIRKHDRPVFSSPLLGVSASPATSFVNPYDSFSQICPDMVRPRPLGNLNPGTVAMRNYLTQKYSQRPPFMGPSTSTYVPGMDLAQVPSTSTHIPTFTNSPDSSDADVDVTHVSPDRNILHELLSEKAMKRKANFDHYHVKTSALRKVKKHASPPPGDVTITTEASTRSPGQPQPLNTSPGKPLIDLHSDKSVTITKEVVNRQFSQWTPSAGEKRNETKVDDDNFMFDISEDGFDGFDKLEIDKTIQELDASIKELQDFQRDDINCLPAVNISEFTESESDRPSDDQIENVIKILEKHSEQIASELSDEPKKLDIPQVPKLDTAHIISQIDFSDLLKSTDSADTKNKSHSEFSRLFKTKLDASYKGIGPHSAATGESSHSTQYVIDITHSDGSGESSSEDESPNQHFYKFRYTTHDDQSKMSTVHDDVYAFDPRKMEHVTKPLVRQAKMVELSIPSTSVANKPSTSFANQPSTSFAKQLSTSFADQRSISIVNQMSTSFTNQPSTSFADQTSTPIVNEPSTSIVNEPSIPFANQPSTSFADQTSTPTVSEPSTSFVNEPSTPLVNEPSIPFANQPSTSFADQTSSPIVNEPSTSFVNKPSTSFVNEPSTPIVNETSTPIVNEPSIPFANQSLTSFANQTSPSIVNEPSPSFVNEPSIPIANQPSTSFVNEPSIPIANQPLTSFANQTSPSIVNEPSIPFENQPSTSFANQTSPSIVNEPSTTIVNEPSTSFANQPSSSIVNEPSIRFTDQPSTSPVNEPSISFVNQSLTSFASQPSTSFSNKTSTSIVNESSTSFANQTSTSIVNEPTTSIVNEPSTFFTDQPSTSTVNEPSTFFTDQPSTSPVNEPSTSFANQPSTSFASQPSTSFASRSSIIRTLLSSDDHPLPEDLRAASPEQPEIVEQPPVCAKYFVPSPPKMRGPSHSLIGWPSRLKPCSDSDEDIMKVIERTPSIVNYNTPIHMAPVIPFSNNLRFSKEQDPTTLLAVPPADVCPTKLPDADECNDRSSPFAEPVVAYTTIPVIMDFHADKPLEDESPEVRKVTQILSSTVYNDELAARFYRRTHTFDLTSDDEKRVSDSVRSSDVEIEPLKPIETVVISDETEDSVTSVAKTAPIKASIHDLSDTTSSDTDLSTTIHFMEAIRREKYREAEQASPSSRDSVVTTYPESNASTARSLIPSQEGTSSPEPSVSPIRNIAYFKEILPTSEPMSSNDVETSTESSGSPLRRVRPRKNRAMIFYESSESPIRNSSPSERDETIFSDVSGSPIRYIKPSNAYEAICSDVSGSPVRKIIPSMEDEAIYDDVSGSPIRNIKPAKEYEAICSDVSGSPIRKILPSKEHEAMYEDVSGSPIRKILPSGELEALYEDVSGSPTRKIIPAKELEAIYSDISGSPVTKTVPTSSTFNTCTFSNIMLAKEITATSAESSVPTLSILPKELISVSKCGSSKSGASILRNIKPFKRFLKTSSQSSASPLNNMILLKKFETISSESSASPQNNIILSKKFETISSESSSSPINNITSSRKFESISSAVESSVSPISNITSEAEASASPLNNITSEAESSASPLNNITSEAEASASPLNYITLEAIASPKNNISSEGNAGASPLNNITAEAETSASPLNNITSEGEASASPLNNITAEAETSASPLNNITSEGEASASPLNYITSEAITSPKNNISSEGEASASPLNNITSEAETSASPLNNITSEAETSASPLNNITLEAEASASPLNYITSEAIASPKNNISSEGEASASPLNNITSEAETSASPLNNITSEAETSASPLNNITLEAEASASPLNYITSEAIASPLNNITAEADTSASPLNNMTSEGEASASPLNNIIADAETSASPLNNITSEGEASASSLNNITAEAETSASPLNNITSEGEASASPLNNITSEAETSASPLNNITSEAETSASPKNNITSVAETSVSPINSMTSEAEASVSPLNNMTSEAEISVSPINNMTSEAEISVSPINNMTSEAETSASPTNNITSVATASPIINISSEASASPINISSETEASASPINNIISSKKSETTSSKARVSPIRNIISSRKIETSSEASASPINYIKHSKKIDRTSSQSSSSPTSIILPSRIVTSSSEPSAPKISNIISSKKIETTSSQSSTSATSTIVPSKRIVTSSSEPSAPKISKIVPSKKIATTSLEPSASTSKTMIPSKKIVSEPRASTSKITIPSKKIVSEPSASTSKTMIPSKKIVSEPCASTSKTMMPSKKIASEPSASTLKTTIPSKKIASEPSASTSKTMMPSKKIASEPSASTLKTTIPSKKIVSEPSASTSKTMIPSKKSVSEPSASTSKTMIPSKKIASEPSASTSKTMMLSKKIASEPRASTSKTMMPSKKIASEPSASTSKSIPPGNKIVPTCSAPGEMLLKRSIITSTTQPAPVPFTSFGNSLRILREGDGFQLVSIPSLAKATTRTDGQIKSTTTTTQVKTANNIPIKTTIIPTSVPTSIILPAGSLMTKPITSASQIKSVTMVGNIALVTVSSSKDNAKTVNSPTTAPTIIKAVPTKNTVPIVAQTKTTNSLGTITTVMPKTVEIRSKPKPLTTFTNSLKLARETKTIKAAPIVSSPLESKKPPGDSNKPRVTLQSVITISDSDDSDVIEVASFPSTSKAPTSFKNVLKRRKLTKTRTEGKPLRSILEYEDEHGVKKKVLVQTKPDRDREIDVEILSKVNSSDDTDTQAEIKFETSSDEDFFDRSSAGHTSQSTEVIDVKIFEEKSSDSSSEDVFTVFRAKNGQYRVKSTNKSVPDRSSELGKQLTSDRSLGTHRFRRSDDGDSSSSGRSNVRGRDESQESNGTVSNSPSANHSVEPPSASNIVQNNTTTTNGGTVSVVRSTAAVLTSTCSSATTDTSTPTLVNMLIHRPTHPIRATNEIGSRLKQCYYSPLSEDPASGLQLTSDMKLVSSSNIIRATSGSSATVSHHPIISTAAMRGGASSTVVSASPGTPHLLSFVNSSQLLKSISTSDGVKPLQLLYKISDGKTYITPVSLQSSVKMAAVNKQQTGEIVKVEVISQPTKLSTNNLNNNNSNNTNNNMAAASSVRSVFEETYAKFIHIGRSASDTPAIGNVTTAPSNNTASTLPKFQQAFGKTTNFAGTTPRVSNASSTEQPLLLVSKMSNANVVVSSTAPIVTSTITVTSSASLTPITVTSTIQRVLSSATNAMGAGNQVRLVKTQSANKVLDKNDCDVDSNASSDSLPPASTNSSTSVTIPGGAQQSQTVLTPMRLALPIVQRTAAGGIPTTRVMTPVLLRQRVLLTSGTVGTPIRLPQNARVLTSNMNTLEPAVSSSTLEQLREFDKVFEKVKERSTTVQPAGAASASGAAAVAAVTATTVPSTTCVTTARGGSESSSVVTSFKLDNSNTSEDDSASSSNNRSSTPIMATFQTAPHIDTSNLVVGSQHQQQRVSVAYVSSGQLGQTILSSPVVVMQQQPASAPSPALSVTSQSSASSPSSSNNPTSSSKPINKTITAAASKSIKNKPIKPNTASPLKASPVPKPQQKPQEDEGTAQRIYSILAEYAEQLRNSPDLNNKPAPRRRSNPPANPSQNSKRKKSSGGKKVSTGSSVSGMEMSPGAADDHRTIGSEDSSCGVLHLSQLQDSPSQAMLSMDDAQSTEGSMDIPGMRGLHGDSNDCIDRPSSSQSASAASVSVPTSSSSCTTQHRQLILTDSSNSSGNRNVIITDSVVSEALAQVGKITNAATVLVPGNYLLPMSMMKGGHQITIVSGGSKILAVKPLKLPTTSNSAGTSQQITATQVLVPTHAASNQKLSTQLLNRVTTSDSNLIRTQTVVDSGRDNMDSGLSFNSAAVLTVQSSSGAKNNVTLSETSTRNTSHQLQLSALSQVNDPTTISGSNGPLLSQLCELTDNGTHSSIILADGTNMSNNVINVSPIHNGKVDRDCTDNTKNSFKKSWANSSITDALEHQATGTSPVFRHSPGMQYASIDSSQGDKKRNVISGGTTTTTTKQMSIQAQRKQAAIERELRLQKSLSEECEDLGVDEPSASDLFPEAEILFDNTNQSPSFGGNVLLQDVTTTCSNEDNTDIFNNALDNGRDITSPQDLKLSSKMSINDHIDYLLVQNKHGKINKNGTSKFSVAQCSNSSQSSYEDTNTLITNTPLISDVTIPSPLPQSTSYCLPSPYRAESPLTQATHSHLYTYSKKSNSKLAAKKGRSYSLFESDCELSSSSHDDSNSRTSSTSADQKDNDSLSDSASEAQSDNNTRKYSRKRPYKLYVYDENGVDASSFACDKDETHETGHHSLTGGGTSSDNNEESLSADMLEGMDLDSSQSSPNFSDSDLASISGTRRASKRGHVRKGCPCCTTGGSSSPPSKRKFGKKAFSHHAAAKKIGGKKIS